MIISIHAPVKGATYPDADGERGNRISIHAPVKGATDRRMKSLYLDPISIHAPVKGATRPYRSRQWSTGHFNPRTREGRDVPQ